MASLRQLCWGMGQPNGTQEPALDIAFLFPGLGQGPLLSLLAVDFQVPMLLGSPVLTLTSHLSVPSLLRKSSAIEESSAGPGLTHGPVSGQLKGTSEAALLSHRGPGHTIP